MLVVAGIVFIPVVLNCNAACYSRAIDDSMAAVLADRVIYLEFLASSETTSKDTIELFLKQNQGSLKPFYSPKGHHFAKPVYSIPLDHLSDSGRHSALKNLFPKDSVNEAGWIHRVTYAGPGGETLWRIAEWFTGSGDNADILSEHNKIKADNIKVGQTIIIPSSLLAAQMKSTQSAPIIEGDLAFKTDAKGAFAEYILRKGETIYSNVVMRFTPRITSQEVLDAADIILERSALKSFHDIPANSRLKIPTALLSPQYLPLNDPTRIKYEQTTQESSQYKKTVQIKHLTGVTVVLDSGHGGIDPGAVGPFGECEDEFAYDVMCRVKELLESTTKANVITTIIDFETQFKLRNTKQLLSLNNQEKILTTPPYLIQDAGFALSLRWMLANYHYRRLSNTTQNASEQIVFTSFHADSLHPNAQGIMVYLPGADYYKGNISKSDSAFNRYTECKSQTKVSMTRKDKLRAQGFSVSLAQKIIQSAKSGSVRVHSDQPIRKYIVRSKKVFVPSVLQFTQIPTRVLIELANLKNETDRKRLQNPDYRQSLARIYVDALIRHFSEK